MQIDEAAPTFHPFSKLPPLIRRRIWALNLPAHRIVEVVEKDGYFYGHSVVTVANLYVCRESRTEALKTHPLSFSVNFAPPMIPFNFDKDTLLLARNLNGQHVVFKRNCNKAELARVTSLMVDTWLQWQVRTHNNRGWRLCGMSWPIFSGLREYFALYTGQTDPLPFWADARWFPDLGPKWQRRCKADASRDADVLKKFWRARAINRWAGGVSKDDRERYRYGGIPENDKFDPAIRRWKIPSICWFGVDDDIIDDFNSSRDSKWAELLMDRAIEDIFD